MADTTKLTPNINIYCINIIIGNNKIVSENPTPENIINPKTSNNEIRNPIQLLVTTENGSISLGK
jgi:hypothetical protein